MSHLRLVLAALLTLLVAACVPPAPPTPGQPANPSATPATGAAARPRAVEYSLGATTVTQASFPEDSRFRHMPVQLNGLIAVPGTGDGPFPVVVILHGTHPGCPVIDHVDRWPCDPADEQPNYRGFGYLAEHLAANGFIALSLNINAENTFGFGEPAPGERVGQIVDKHLRALALASAGGANQFGVALKGKADLHRLALAGHSRGGEMALELARGLQTAAGGADGYGPVAGVLQIAPSPVFADPAKGSPVPLGILLPMCDADVVNLDGQAFYESARLAPDQKAWVTSAFLEAANHNYFNSILGDDPFGRVGRPDCDARLEAQAQQTFLEEYAVDFLVTLFGSAGEASAAKTRLGMDASTPAPSALYGQAARVAVLPGAAGRRALFTPVTADETKTNRLGGEVRAEGAGVFFCEAGYYTPTTHPGTEPCRRATVVIPGNPALAVVSWDRPGATLRFALPQGKGDLSSAAALSLRAAVDPLARLNAKGKAQVFSIRVTDGAGRSATVVTRPDEPALRFPQGQVTEDDLFGDMFTGRVPLTTVRIPAAALPGVDWSDVREIAVQFDQTSSGALFLADLEWEQGAK